MNCPCCSGKLKKLKGKHKIAVQIDSKKEREE